MRGNRIQNNGRMWAGIFSLGVFVSAFILEKSDLKFLDKSSSLFVIIGLFKILLIIFTVGVVLWSIYMAGTVIYDTILNAQGNGRFNKIFYWICYITLGIIIALYLATKL